MYLAEVRPKKRAFRLWKCRNVTRSALMGDFKYGSLFRLMLFQLFRPSLVTEFFSADSAKLNFFLSAKIVGTALVRLSHDSPDGQFQPTANLHSAKSSQ